MCPDHARWTSQSAGVLVNVDSHVGICAYFGHELQLLAFSKGFSQHQLLLGRPVSRASSFSTYVEHNHNDIAMRLAYMHTDSCIRIHAYTHINTIHIYVYIYARTCRPYSQTYTNIFYNDIQSCTFHTSDVKGCGIMLNVLNNLDAVRTVHIDSKGFGCSKWWNRLAKMRVLQTRITPNWCWALLVAKQSDAKDDDSPYWEVTPRAMFRYGLCKGHRFIWEWSGTATVDDKLNQPPLLNSLGLLAVNDNSLLRNAFIWKTGVSMSRVKKYQQECGRRTGATGT